MKAAALSVESAATRRSTAQVNLSRQSATDAFQSILTLALVDQGATSERPTNRERVTDATDPHPTAGVFLGRHLLDEEAGTRAQDETEDLDRQELTLTEVDR